MAKKTKLVLRKLKKLLFEKTTRICPICGWKGRQFALGGDGNKQRFDSKCSRCGSFERHRLAYLVANNMSDLDFSKTVHVAPEKCLSKWLQLKSSQYLSLDFYSKAMTKMDITNLGLASRSCTIFWASNVLEHITDDRKAISEIYRVLSPGGKAFIQVPIWKIDTFEDFSKSTPEERNELFYQHDHVRLYGMDITDRFEHVGFSTEIYRAQDFGPKTLLENGLSFASTNEVFVFTKVNKPSC